MFLKKIIKIENILQICAFNNMNHIMDNEQRTSRFNAKTFRQYKQKFE